MLAIGIDAATVVYATQALDRFLGEIDGNQELDQAVERVAERQSRRLADKPEPPPPTNSRYVRTGRFSDSWRVDPGTQESSRLIVNDATDENGRLYPDFVAGHQAYMHVGRWWQVESELDEIKDDLKDELEKLVNEAIGSVKWLNK